MKNTLLLAFTTIALAIPSFSWADQGDYDISNSVSGMRGEINSNLDAIQTNNSGATAPTSTQAFQWWVDTSDSDNPVLKMRNKDNNGWIDVGKVKLGGFKDLNTMVNAFRIATNAQDGPHSVLNGVADAFQNENGVDTSPSTNEQYISAGTYYSPTNDSSANEVNLGTSAGGEALGDFLGVEYRPAQSFQLASTAIVSQVDLAFGATGGSPTGQVTVTIQTDSSTKPSGTLADPSASVVFTPTANSVNTIAFAKPFQLTGSTKYWIVVQCDNQSNDNYWTVTATTGNKYANGERSYSNTGGSFPWPAASTDVDSRFEVHAGTAQNMTLQSNHTEATPSPAKMRLALFEEDIDSVTLNTDLKAWVSKDDGVTWTQVTLENRGQYESGGSRLLTGVAVFSTPLSGTFLRWKVTTHNNKALKLHGVTMDWY